MSRLNTGNTLLSIDFYVKCDFLDENHEFDMQIISF